MIIMNKQNLYSFDVHEIINFSWYFMWMEGILSEI